MSFAKNECQQLTLNDSIFSLTSRENKMLEKSWAKLFAEEIFPKIDEEKYKNFATDILPAICLIRLDPKKAERYKGDPAYAEAAWVLLSNALWG